MGYVSFGEGSQNGNLPQIGVKVKHIWNHHLDEYPPVN